MDSFVCPKGHASTEPDYCSECGAKIDANLPAGGTAQLAADPALSHLAGEVCPDCGTVREGSGIDFCEVCGYNFTTGAHGELPLRTPDPPPPTPAPEPLGDPSQEPQPPNTAATATATTPAANTWTVTLSVDPSLRQSISPAAPASFAPVTIAIENPTTLIGRRSQARAIFPEIAIGEDDAVSHRHALLSLDSVGALVLRDIGSSNGTRLNGTELTPMTDHPLSHGDTVTLGHWSVLKFASIATGNP